jgi:hypothetical protein
MAAQPWAGMAWMHMQIAAGLLKLGHDVYYVEATSEWPYDPKRNMKVPDADYAVPYLAGVAESFGLRDRWAYRQSASDGEWFGLDRLEAEDLLAHADAVLNVTGATNPAEVGLKIGRLVYFGTDPVGHEVAFAQGDPGMRALIEQHQDIVTYGENIGSPDCPIPPLPRLRARTRQPVLMEMWQSGPPSKEVFTTVANWRQLGHDLVFSGETYAWSKHEQFMKFVDVPRRVGEPVELACGIDQLTPDERRTVEAAGWRLVDAHAFTTDPWSYRAYVRSSRGEFTVAKDFYVRPRSGWFSERSACYLAAGRPVITQDTGFSAVLPTGEGLFAFTTTEDVLAAFEKVRADYARQSRAAHDVAEEYFRAERVLAKVLEDLGL